MRLFIAIPLPAGVARELSEVSKRLRSDQDGLRWASPESWHITLQFLGNTAPEQYACLIAKLREVHSPPIPIALKDLGIFDRAGVFFADVAVSQELLTTRREAKRVSAQQLERGAYLPSQADAAVAQEFAAQTLLLQSQLEYAQAQDELTDAIGQTAR